MTEYTDYRNTNGQLPSLNPKCLRRLCEEEIRRQNRLVYASESDSDEDDYNEEEGSPNFMSRIHRIRKEILETSADSSENSPPTDTCNYKPADMNDFDWKTLPIPEFKPMERREKFTEDNCGPTAAFVDPYDTFVSVWDRPFMEYIAKETNRYAQQYRSLDKHLHRRIAGWQDTTVDELYVYFALILMMGTIRPSNVEKYWSEHEDRENIFFVPFFLEVAKHMTLRRFLQLNKCLHFSDNENIIALNTNEKKIFKIEPFVLHLNKKFQQNYNLDRDIAVEESLTEYILENKEVKIKSYEICECKTGYLWRFEIHAGSLNPSHVKSEQTVVNLLKGLENKGHTVWMSVSHTSPALARRLKSVGFDCVGNVLEDRQHLPYISPELTDMYDYTGRFSLNSQRSVYSIARSSLDAVSFTSGDVDFMLCRGQWPMTLISTYHGDEAVFERGVPTLIRDFLAMVDRLDKRDELLNMHPIERKKRVWYKNLFRRLLNISLYNCYILAEKSTENLKLSDFRVDLIISILDKHSELKNIKQGVNLKDKFFYFIHYVDKYPYLPNEKSRRKIIQQKPCHTCKKLTRTFCSGCCKATCLGPCFAALHNVEILEDGSIHRLPEPEDQEEWP